MHTKSIATKFLTFLMITLISMTCFSQRISAEARYSITINSSLNGTVTSNSELAKAEDSVYLDVKPSTGYVLDTLTYTYTLGGKNYKEGIDSNYFVMPAADVTIDAEFVAKENFDFKASTGIFGKEYSNKIDNIAKYLDTSADQLEKDIDTWLTTDENNDLLSIFKCSNRQEMYKKIALYFLYYDTYFNNISTKEEGIEITKCVLNSDVFFKGFAKIIENSRKDNILGGLSIEGPKTKDELVKCEGSESNACSLKTLRDNLKAAKDETTTLTPAETTTYKQKLINTIKRNLANTYELYGFTSLDEIDEEFIDETLDYLAYYKSAASETESFFEKISINGYEFMLDFSTWMKTNAVEENMSPLELTLNDYDAMQTLAVGLKDYEGNDIDAFDVFYCYLNSDVFFKAKAKKIEAMQTNNIMTIMTTYLSLFPSSIDEHKKALGEDTYYVDEVTKKFFSDKYQYYSITNNNPKGQNDDYLSYRVYNAEENAEAALNGSKIIINCGKKGRDIDKLCYNDGSKDINITDIDENGDYYFIMPAKNITIHATFKDAELKAPAVTTFQYYNGCKYNAAASINDNAKKKLIRYRTKTTLEGNYGDETSNIPQITNIGKLYVKAYISGDESNYIEYVLEVTKHNLYITPDASQSKKYGEDDGTITYKYEPLSLLNSNDEVPSFSGKLSRISGENVGEYAITVGNLTLNDNGKFKKDNYQLVINDVKYAITKAEMEYTLGDSIDTTYDGKEHKITINMTKPASGASTSYSLDNGVTWNKGQYSLTNVGETSVKFKIEADNYEDAITEARTIKVNKRDVTLTSASAYKTYDGTPLTNDKVIVSSSGFVQGEGATYNVNGSQTIKGSSKNTFSYNLNLNTIASNYNITFVEGDLVVSYASVDKDESKNVNEYNGNLSSTFNKGKTDEIIIDIEDSFNDNISAKLIDKSTKAVTTLGCEEGSIKVVIPDNFTSKLTTGTHNYTLSICESGITRYSYDLTITIKDNSSSSSYKVVKTCTY